MTTCFCYRRRCVAAVLLAMFVIGVCGGLIAPRPVMAAIDKIVGNGKKAAVPNGGVSPSGCQICHQTGWVPGHYDQACMSVAQEGCYVVAAVAGAAAAAEVLQNGGTTIAAAAASAAATRVAYRACIAGCYVPGYYSDRTCSWYDPCPTP